MRLRSLSLCLAALVLARAPDAACVAPDWASPDGKRWTLLPE